MIDTHPLKNQVIAMLIEGKNQNKVAEMIGCSRATVNNYIAKNLKPLLYSSSQNADTKTVLPVMAKALGITKDYAVEASSRQGILARLQKHEPLADTAIANAAELKDFSGMASVMNARKSHIELEARILGVLDERPVSNVNVIMMSGDQVIEETPVTLEADYTSD